MSGWDALESPLSPSPQFYVQAPDGRKDWMETGKGGRQETFMTLGHRFAPRVLTYHICNEGRRSPFMARRIGIMSGVFDNRIEWRAPLTAVVEMKGYSKAGRPGQLSDAQVEFGNRMTDLGHHAACFFDPYAAWDWLRDLGFPVMVLRRAA